jgi:CRISPR-associated protein Cas5 subtype I-C
MHVIRLKVWGPRALFSRPEMKVERVSYDVITPSAARGTLEAIHWKPQMVWRIQRLYVLNPIRFESLRRNEVGSKIRAGKGVVQNRRFQGNKDALERPGCEAGFRFGSLSCAEGRPASADQARWG